MKKFTLILSIIAAGTFAMAADIVSYDQSSHKSSDVVHYDNRSYGNSGNVVHYDNKDKKSHQEASQTEKK